MRTFGVVFGIIEIEDVRVAPRGGGAWNPTRPAHAAPRTATAPATVIARDFWLMRGTRTEPREVADDAPSSAPSAGS